LIEIINKQLLLQLVGYLCYWQMGFNSVFKELNFASTVFAMRSVCFNITFKTPSLVTYFIFFSNQQRLFPSRGLTGWSL